MGPRIEGGQFVFLVEAAAVQKNVDLTHLEATDLELDLRRKFQDLGELERERLAVPCGILSNPVERKAQHPQLGVRQVRQADRRHLAEAQLLCGQHQSPARNDPPLGIDQDRQNETEPIEARGKLAHLLGRVLAGLSSQGPAGCDRDKPGGQVARKRVAVSATLDPSRHDHLLLLRRSGATTPARLEWYD